MITEEQDQTHQSLLDFLLSLRHYGFDVDLHQISMAQDLILHRINQQRLPEKLDNMGSLLAPVIATNPQQQRHFYYLFNQWVITKSKQEDKAGERHRPDHQVTSKQPDETEGLAEKNVRKCSSIYKIVFIAVIALLVSVSGYLGFKQSIKQFCIEIDWCDKPVVIEVVDNKTPFKNITTFQESGTLLPSTTINLLLPQEIPVSIIQRLGLSGLPLLLLVIWYLWLLYSRSLYLEQKSTRNKPDEDQQLSIPPAQRHLFQHAKIRHSFQLMRKHRLIASRDLDVDKTVAETIREGGVISHYYQQRKALPEYLLLLDRECAGEQQLRLYETMINAMVNEGVIVERYYFDGDPRITYRQSIQGKWYKLQDLGDLYRDYRLIIVSDAERFFHPINGLPASWLEEAFQSWLQTVVLTPKDFQHWGQKELVLHRNGLLVSPTSLTGVALMGRHMESEQVLESDFNTALYDGVSSVAALPKQINMGSEKWLEAVPPSDAELQLLLAELSAYLGPQGYLWLSACCVYPSLQWDLTANLGLRLARLQNMPLPDEDDYLYLLRLPWFDVGFMPQYLREVLIGEMSRSNERLIRQLIEGLLEEGELDKTLNTVLPIAKAKWKDWRIRLAALYKGVDENSPLRDYVFMNFLMGRKLRKTHFKLPGFLQKMLMKAGPGLLDLRNGVLSMMLALFSLLIWLQSEAWVIGTEIANDMIETPEMIVIGAGSFQMGDIQGTGADDEKPVHTVVFTKPFAMSTKEITFREYDAFANATGRPLPDDENWGRGEQPVINVSWEDAKAYAQWLSKKTGKLYRLPTEAEWEYAARAGAETDYSWGNNIGVNNANCEGCGSQWDRQQTAPVGSFQANRFGLYDMHGNVWEWIEDCWNASYDGAPVDGSAWKGGNCDKSVLRGGSWINFPLNLRSSYRLWLTRPSRFHYTGFRLVQDLFIKREFTDPLRDGGNGPVMVTIPPGRFQMGDLQGGGHSSEKPVHPVVISHSFAIGKTEVTFDDYDRFARATGKELPKDRDWGRGDRPVIYVSWDDAKAYAAWLSEQTGKHYRLPTEAEWEYAARAGTVTAYHWGDKASHEFANYGKDECCDGLVEGKDQWLNTAPVGQFPANGFGLHDMHGNVYEWVEDCWNGSYEGAPDDGSAWKAGDCDVSVLRGGSWDSNPRGLRSSYRVRSTRTNRSDDTGFRLVQD